MNAEQLLAAMRDGAYVVERYKKHLGGVITIRVLVMPDGTSSRVQDSTINALIGQRRVWWKVDSQGTIPPLYRFVYRDIVIPESRE